MLLDDLERVNSLSLSLSLSLRTVPVLLGIPSEVPKDPRACLIQWTWTRWIVCPQYIELVKPSYIRDLKQLHNLTEKFSFMMLGACLERHTLVHHVKASLFAPHIMSSFLPLTESKLCPGQ